MLFRSAPMSPFVTMNRPDELRAPLKVETRMDYISTPHSGLGPNTSPLVPLPIQCGEGNSEGNKCLSTSTPALSAKCICPGNLTRLRPPLPSDGRGTSRRKFQSHLTLPSPPAERTFLKFPLLPSSLNHQPSANHHSTITQPSLNHQPSTNQTPYETKHHQFSHHPEGRADPWINAKSAA